MYDLCSSTLCVLLFAVVVLLFRSDIMLRGDDYGRTVRVCVGSSTIMSINLHPEDPPLDEVSLP